MAAPDSAARLGGYLAPSNALVLPSPDGAAESDAAGQSMALMTLKGTCVEDMSPEFASIIEDAQVVRDPFLHGEPSHIEGLDDGSGINLHFVRARHSSLSLPACCSLYRFLSTRPLRTTRNGASLCSSTPHVYRRSVSFALLNLVLSP